VTIGRHCLLAAQIGLAGSLTIGDNVVLSRDNAADFKGEGQA
jgi:UDP-3-O-[3-hydroxymyristoyl] glucosamine N-acyltransferase